MVRARQRQQGGGTLLIPKEKRFGIIWVNDIVPNKTATKAQTNPKKTFTGNCMQLMEKGGVGEKEGHNKETPTCKFGGD